MDAHELATAVLAVLDDEPDDAVRIAALMVAFAATAQNEAAWYRAIAGVMQNRANALRN
jgi:ribosomal protein S12 methylthiotransferase accessory factor YcaO